MNYKFVRNWMGTVCVVALALVTMRTEATAANVTLNASDGSQSGFSYSWLHAATSGIGGPDGGGFYMNGQARRFTPFTFTGDWDGSKLTIDNTTQEGVIQGGNVNTDVTLGDKLYFLGGVLEQIAGDVVRGFIEYEILDGATNNMVDGGYFFVWGSSAFAGPANGLSAVGPVDNVSLTLDVWANNWVNGLSKDWGFLTGLDSNFVVTTSGGNTTSVTYDGTAARLTSDGSAPDKGVNLGLDLHAGGTNTTVVPSPTAAAAVPMLLIGMGVMKLRRRRLLA